MSVSYFVFYQGESRSDATFLERYRRVHVPLLLKFPGITRVRLHESSEASDPHAVHPGGFLLICEMVFDDTAALEAALASIARAEARADFERFPEFHGRVWHQAMRTEDVRP